jgi:MFS family permease
MTPVLATVGIGIFAIWPWIFAGNVYAGLVIGTLIFSAASGFIEVLISPIIAEIPSDDPDREMSKLHSVYAWGSVGVVIISTLYIFFIGAERWQWLALAFCLIPIASAILFAGADIPKMKTPEKMSGVLGMFKNETVWLCVFAIFLGGAAECTMSQWCSGYIEGALGIPKLWGDIFGVALFALALGLGRTLYAKFGKNIEKVILLGAIGATLCYLVAALSSVAFVGLVACSFTGFCVSMLWPGSLVVASERISDGGVFIFALMAAGGDFGASVGPQLVGVITDAVMESEAALAVAERFSITVEQLGMKAGMLMGMLFPLLAVFVYFIIYKSKKNKPSR